MIDIKKYDKEFDEYLLDARLHIRTIGRIEDYANDHIYPYEPTSYSVLGRLADSGMIGPEDHLLDYGCGKARTLVYLSDRIRCRATGVELMRDFYEVGRSNIEAYDKSICKPAGRSCKIEIVRCEAQKYEVPETVSGVFFFNPFSVEIFESVMKKILESYYGNPRRIRLFLYYPQSAYVALLSRMDEVMFVDEIDCMDLFIVRDDRNRIMIFELGSEEE